MTDKTISDDPVRVHRYVDPAPNTEEAQTESSGAESRLRPRSFGDFPGQARAKQNLEVYVRAACERSQSLDHVLLHGPPGLGKTSLARVIASELQVPFYQTSGPAIDKAGDLAGILAGLEERAVLFIDEIHRLSIVVEEMLYSAMEDYFIDVVVGQGPTARTVKMPIPSFTLIGATTRISMLSSPLVSRFGIKERFEFYEQAALATIVLRSASLEGVDITKEGAHDLAKRSRGTPRIANRLLRRVRDFAQVAGEREVGAQTVDRALNAMEIDAQGLEPMDRSILSTVLTRYKGGPVGVETLAHTLGEDRATIEEVYEPFLVHRGFLQRGPRGREVTAHGITHLETLGYSCDTNDLWTLNKTAPKK